MATKPLSLLRAARKASLASRSAAAAASRAARAAGVAADIARAAGLSLDLIWHPKSCSNCRFPTSADYEHLPEDSKTLTDKDFESDEAVWALYEHWCNAFDKKRDRAEMVRRFKIFKYNAHDQAEMVRRFKIFKCNAEDVQSWNTHVPADPKKAAICLKKRMEAKLLLSKGQDISFR